MKTYYQYNHKTGKRYGKGVQARNKTEAISYFMEEERRKGFEVQPLSRPAKMADRPTESSLGTALRGIDPSRVGIDMHTKRSKKRPVWEV